MTSYEHDSLNLLATQSVQPLNDWVIFFQYAILFLNVVQQKCNIFIWNWSNELNV